MPRPTIPSPLSPLTVAALLLAPTAALAHTGAGATHGLAHGFMHPIGGLDHILAMVTVGVFASQLGGRALWLVPATFVLVMAAGGAAAMAGLATPFIEIGIAASVIVLGAMVALKVRAPLAAAMGLVGFFAIFHGYAHGAEMPHAAAGAVYGLGFMAATALLHAAGIGLGLAAGRIGERHGTTAYRIAGCVVAAAGLGLLSGVL
ncbi:MAG: urease accessory protein [Rhizobiales bacterium]|nr:urease accessory protein [Hyphomicrobiales bacterium]